MKIRVFNPLGTDFICYYDRFGKNIKLTVNALEFASFEVHLAGHVKKHLANKILHKRGVKTNVEDDLKKIMEELSGE